MEPVLSHALLCFALLCFALLCFALHPVQAASHQLIFCTSPLPSSLYWQLQRSVSVGFLWTAISSVTATKCAKCAGKVRKVRTVCSAVLQAAHRVHLGSACSGCQGRGSNKGLQGCKRPTFQLNFSTNIIEHLKWSQGPNFVWVVNLSPKTNLVYNST